MHKDRSDGRRDTDGKGTPREPIRGRRKSHSFPEETDKNGRHENESQEAVVGSKLQHIAMRELRMALEARNTVLEMKPLPRVWPGAERQMVAHDFQGGPPHQRPTLDRRIPYLERPHAG